MFANRSNINSQSSAFQPLIDAKVQSTWDLPTSWELKAQLVFGKPEGDAGPKEFA